MYQIMLEYVRYSDDMKETNTWSRRITMRTTRPVELTERIPEFDKINDDYIYFNLPCLNF